MMDVCAKRVLWCGSRYGANSTPLAYSVISGKLIEQLQKAGVIIA
jgi:hypothetical protein